MNLMSSSYAPEILTRLIREGIEIYKNNALFEIDRGVLTLGEIKEDIGSLKERMSLLYESLGWDSKLIKILDN